MADLRGREGRTPPRASNFFQFHAVFWKFWQNRVFTPPLEGSRARLGEIMDPPLMWDLIFLKSKSLPDKEGTAFFPKFESVQLEFYSAWYSCIVWNSSAGASHFL